eukprot:gnl/TRDRNA2_/TRDRNA2_150807_c0_seq2.p1 gnl/TRDRNA2_/TRDRNA2_150807_c0~~gnl/TRDRNA2_/TRDRNA2_150807_c0_seq2.p1  ORF type:complete len:285 (+),score=21.02 gnl/TRDRNA2_/TRDRNA2_150807_c0_seq2:85-939(+)
MVPQACLGCMVWCCEFWSDGDDLPHRSRHSVFITRSRCSCTIFSNGKCRRIKDHLDFAAGGDELLQQVSSMASDLYFRGYNVHPHFIDNACASALAELAYSKLENGTFEPGALGDGTNTRQAIDTSSRNDHVFWFGHSMLATAERQFFERLKTLRDAINRQIPWMRLLEWEGHMSIYPPNGFFRLHLDAFDNDVDDKRGRKISTILYLNPNWHPDDGGQLRLYVDGTNWYEFIDIPPRSGTLVTFLSDMFYHEVANSSAMRLAISGWFRTQGSSKDMLPKEVDG